MKFLNLKKHGITYWFNYSPHTQIYDGTLQSNFLGLSLGAFVKVLDRFRFYVDDVAIFNEKTWTYLHKTPITAQYKMNFGDKKTAKVELYHEDF